MTPITLEFKQGQKIIVYSDDPRAFTDSVMSSKPFDLHQIVYNPDVRVTGVELKDVKLSLQDGCTIMCRMTDEDIRTAMLYTDIVRDCEETNAMRYADMAKEEAELDARFNACCLFINNIPDLNIRCAAHREYIKRKRAYVSSIEALSDSILRRP